MFDGVRYQGSTKTQNQRVARQIEAAKQVQLAKNEVGIKERKPVPTFAEYAKTFRGKMATKHAAKPKTAAYYANGLDRLLEFDELRTAKLDQIDMQTVKQLHRLAQPGHFEEEEDAHHRHHH